MITVPDHRPSCCPWVAALLAAAVLAALALAPRFIAQDAKPLMHDESMFAWYGYSDMNEGRYVHLPIMHGPTLMLLTARAFERFGDSIAVGRGMIAVCSLVALGCGLMLLPRRLRWWWAPVLLTSPILLYYSRFLRNEMLFCAVAMVGVLGVTRGLTRRRGGAVWGAVGMTALGALLTVKENALFLYASGLSFALWWGLLRLAWRGPLARALRPLHDSFHSSEEPQPHIKVPRARRARRARKETFAHPSYEELVGARMRRAELLEEQAQQEALRRPVFLPVWGVALGWLAGLAAGVGVIAWVYGITSPKPDQFEPLTNLRASWDYWAGQHREHRISGAIHYHLPILLTYELPVMLAIGVGLTWDAMARWGRMALQAGAMTAWVALWGLWRAFPPQSGVLHSALGFLHIEPNLSMLILGALIVPLLAWSALAIKEHRTQAAWLAWWTACSLFQYSSAGEKVPWLAVHIALPMNLLACWVWAAPLHRASGIGRLLALAALLTAVALGLRCDVPLIGVRAADPRERILYNHTSVQYDRFCKDNLAAWGDRSQQTPLKERHVWLAGASGWPGVWYFRHCAYQFGAPQPGQEADLVMGEEDQLAPLVSTLDMSQWKLTQLSLRNHWLAPFPYEREWEDWIHRKELPLGRKPPRLRPLVAKSAAALWGYYWNREVWDWPNQGAYPIQALQPLRMRP